VKIVFVLVTLVGSLFCHGADSSTDWRELWDPAKKSRWAAKSTAAVRAEAEKGNAAAMYVMSERLAEARDKEFSVWQKKAQAAGFPQAIYEQAFSIYEMTPAAQLQKHAIFERVAATGYPEAQWALSLSLQGVEPIPADYDRAVTLMQSAFDQGARFAAFELASMYAAGIGEPRNDAERPMTLFLSLAKKGNTDAMEELGRRYRTGFGTQKDLLKAAYWIACTKMRTAGFEMEFWRYEAFDPARAEVERLVNLFSNGWQNRNRAALEELAALHLTGVSGEKNPVRAAALFTAAGRADKAKELQQNFTPEQTKEFQEELRRR
jgi:TPR repeat protein